MEARGEWHAKGDVSIGMDSPVTGQNPIKMRGPEAGASISNRTYLQMLEGRPKSFGPDCQMTHIDRRGQINFQPCLLQIIRQKTKFPVRTARWRISSEGTSMLKCTCLRTSCETSNSSAQTVREAKWTKLRQSSRTSTWEVRPAVPAFRYPAPSHSSSSLETPLEHFIARQHPSHHLVKPISAILQF